MVVSFGFELTFFRQAVSRDPARTKPWDVRDLYLAHLALSDLDGSEFYHAERTSRAGPGMAGISAADGRIWNGNWQVQWQGVEQKIQAVDARFELRLSFRSEKPPIINGENGVSQKAEGPGRASHYISLTRLVTNGRIGVAGRNFEVTGVAWMDHEFFTHQLENSQVGWDWFSVQLDDNTELMLFRIRRKDGSTDPSTCRHIRRCAGNEHAFAFKRLHAAASGRHLDELRHESRVSHSLGNKRSAFRHRVGGKNSAAVAGAGQLLADLPELLGRRRHIRRPNTAPASLWRRLSGNDGL